MASTVIGTLLAIIGGVLLPKFGIPLIEYGSPDFATKLSSFLSPLPSSSRASTPGLRIVYQATKTIKTTSHEIVSTTTDPVAVAGSAFHWSLLALFLALFCVSFFFSLAYLHCRALHRQAVDHVEQLEDRMNALSVKMKKHSASYYIIYGLLHKSTSKFRQVHNTLTDTLAELKTCQEKLGWQETLYDSAKIHLEFMETLLTEKRADLESKNHELDDALAKLSESEEEKTYLSEMSAAQASKFKETKDKLEQALLMNDFWAEQNERLEEELASVKSQPPNERSTRDFGTQTGGDDENDDSGKTDNDDGDDNESPPDEQDGPGGGSPHQLPDDDGEDDDTNGGGPSSSGGDAGGDDRAGALGTPSSSNGGGDGGAGGWTTVKSKKPGRPPGAPKGKPTVPRDAEATKARNRKHRENARKRKEKWAAEHPGDV